MSMTWPAYLQKGDAVALLAPSGAQPPEKLDAAVDAVRQLGLAPHVYPSCTASHGYLAGDDALRAGDINRAFLDPALRGIICVRGGYGAHRLMDRLNWEAIAQHPKGLYGYSDITALHLALSQRCAMVSFHTPMPGTDAPDAFAMEHLRAALFGPIITAVHNPDGYPLRQLVGGVAQGMLTGGNLSLVVDTLGTPDEIDARGKILFLEDVDEKPYRIDGLLCQLRRAGKLHDCAGVVLGAFTDCTATEPDKSLTLAQIFAELLGDIGRPVMMGLQCGHTMPTLSLPIGAQVRLDADTLTLEVLAP